MQTSKRRIRQIFPHNGAIPNDESVPRGWITPQGQFLKTKEHWASIMSHFRRPDTRSKAGDEAAEESVAAERAAHLAYSLGWISVGHAGRLNAIAHERTFQMSGHPAVSMLRKVLATSPGREIQIETQIGSFIASSGVHEGFELKEYDLDILLKHGRLRQRIGT